jgi:hypothetical protein
LSRKGKKVSMKIGQKAISQRVGAAVIGWALVAGLGSGGNVEADTVADTTVWNTSPGEVVTANLIYLHYLGSIYAGINTITVNNGTSSTVYNGFCIDPFHWSLTTPTPNYSFVPLSDAPKAPAQMNAATAHNIEDLWAEYYSPTMSSYNAAGLQIAIWELISANAVANDGLPSYDAFSLNGSDYGASADIASLATYQGPAANLIALTGPGQDYVVDSVPDGSATLIMLALTLGALLLARAAMIKSKSQVAQAIRINRDAPPRSLRAARLRRCYPIV